MEKYKRLVVSIRYTIAFIFITQLPCISYSAEIQKFERPKVIPLDWDGKLDISGLTYCNDKILAVADNLNKKILELKISNNNSTISTLLNIKSLIYPDVELTFLHALKNFLVTVFYGNRVEVEGIACMDDKYLLASESGANIFILSKQGEHIGTEEIYSQGREHGFFNVYNGFIEGVAYHRNKIIGAIEREPRGLFVLHKDLKSTDFYDLPDDFNLKYLQDSVDISDLEIHENNLYTLERNASAVCKRDINTFKTIICYSFGHIEHDPDLKYVDAKYGLSEGLAISDKHIYVAFDNNGQGRIKHPNDSRPVLLEFKKPSDF